MKLFFKDHATWPVEKKIRLLLRKFDHSEHANYVLSRNPGEISCEDTVLILKKYLGRKVLYTTQDDSASTW